MKFEEPNSDKTSFTHNFVEEGRIGPSFMFLEMKKDELECFLG